jgi:cytochrome c-type biogenesis protein CcmF
MGIAPLLAWRKTSIKSIKKNFLLPIIFSFFIGIVLLSFGIRKVYPLIALVLIGFVLATIILEFYRGTKARMKSSQENILYAFISIIEKNKSRYGGYIVHIGILMMFLGFTGKAFDQESDVSLSPEKNSVNLAEYTFKLKDYWQESPNSHPNTRQNHKAEITSIDIFKEGVFYTNLKPERRIYINQKSQPHSEVALKSTLNKDIYIILGSLDLNTGMTTLKIRLNNLVSWVWLGTLVLIFGTLIALLPERRINE